jgi:hypothetical protein
MLWSNFIELVKDHLTVDAKRRGLEVSILRKIQDGVRDLQSYIPVYREGNERTYDLEDLTANGEASEGSLPSGAEVKDAYIITTTRPCRQTPLSPWPWDNRNELICGSVQGDYISIDPYGKKFLTRPAIDEDTHLVITWDGIRQDFEDDDELPLPKEAAEAVACYVKAWVTKEVDKDLQLSESYRQDYTGDGGGKMGMRTRCYLDARRQTQVSPLRGSPRPGLNCAVVEDVEVETEAE